MLDVPKANDPAAASPSSTVGSRVWTGTSSPTKDCSWMQRSVSEEVALLQATRFGTIELSFSRDVLV